MKQCSYCKRIFESDKSLSNHVRWHNGKMSRNSYLGINKGSKNGQWKGDKVDKPALHEYITKRMDPNKICCDCGSTENIDLANISQQYKRELSDWKWQCRHCHMREDGRVKNLIKEKVKRISRSCLTCHKNFLILPCRVKTAKFCSRECKPAWNKGLVMDDYAKMS